MKKIDRLGTIRYYNANGLHNFICSSAGMPAIIYKDKYLYWVFNDKEHRINGQTTNQNGLNVLYGEIISINIEKLVI